MQNDLEKQAKKIIKIAKESGVQSNYLFVTTFDRYQTQIKILNDLKEVINEGETVVSKEYVKGRPNLQINPAIVEYNRVSSSANKSVATLIRIITNFNVTEAASEEDPLLQALNGVGKDDEQ